MVRKLPNHKFFFDNQLRTIFLHFVRIFNGFQIKEGRDANGFESLKRVPALWGDGSRQAHNIIIENSENTMMSIPRISCYVTGLAMARERASYSGNQDDMLVAERKFDREEETYEGTQGRDYHVTRLMMNPLDITMKVDIVTSNLDQKCQLFEQIYMVFNPMLEMQVYSNPLHWTPIKRVTLQEIEWESQSIPHGADDELNIMSFIFKVEADINPPARVKKQKLIHTIIQELGFEASLDDSFCEDDDKFYNITTPGNHTIRVEDGQITLLGPYKNLIDPATNAVYSWPQLIDMYGELRDGYNKIRLRWVSDINDDSEDIIGYISYDPDVDNILLFTVDPNTLPGTTLSPINAIINPHISLPGHGLPADATGQRYMLTESIGSGTDAWGTLSAELNDIIEYNGSNWVVSLDAATTDTIEVVADLSTGRIFRLVNHNWVDAINADYLAGYFRLMI